MRLEVIRTPKVSASENMRFAEDLLLGLSTRKECILHFYQWKHPSATYGYFIDPERFLNPQGIKKFGLDIARRPTGGGILFHTCDLAFGVLVPACHPRFSVNTLDNYALINNGVKAAVERFIGCESAALLKEESEPDDSLTPHFCMAKPTKYDVMIAGKKVGGAAQRRTKAGFLHQGTLSLSFPSQDYLEEVLHSDSCIAQAMRRNSYPLAVDPSRLEASLIDEISKSLESSSKN